MQPEEPINPNITPTNSPPPPPPPQFQSTMPQVQPVAIQPQPEPVAQTQPQPSVVAVSSSAYSVGYLSTLRNLFTNPEAYLNSRTSDLAHAAIFPVVSLLIMSVVLAITKIVSVLTMKVPTSIFSTESSSSSAFDRLSGAFWGELFKGMGLGTLYAILFIGAVSGIIMLFSLIAKRSTAFKDIFSMSSIFALNFLALAATAVIGLLSVWIDNSDFASVIALINNLIISLVFIYSVYLIIQGISDLTGFDVFKSTAIMIISTLTITFLMGKLFHSDFSSYFNVSFGGYNSSTSIDLQTIENTLQDKLNEVFSSY